MKKLLALLVFVACNSGDSARITQLEAALKECRAQSAQGTPSAPSGIVAASTEAALLTEITVGDRTYKVLPILRGKEESVRGNTMVERAKEMGAHLGQEDGEYLLAHQNDIPGALRDEVAFAFTNWPRPVNLGDITIIYWNGDRWVQAGRWLANDWLDYYRVLRRKSK